MSASLEHFDSYYKSKHQGRRLTWSHAHATVTLTAYFPKGTKELSVSLLQAAVLLLFNDGDELEYTDILNSTGIGEFIGFAI